MPVSVLCFAIGLSLFAKGIEERSSRCSIGHAKACIGVAGEKNCLRSETVTIADASFGPHPAATVTLRTADGSEHDYSVDYSNVLLYGIGSQGTAGYRLF